jgi:hypothetical protein
MGKSLRKSNAAPHCGVFSGLTEESAMKASDLDGRDAHLLAPSVPPSGGWLRVVGVALAIVLICAIWTFWA